MSKALDTLFKDYPARITAEQLTEILGISDKTVTYRWLREGRVPAIRLGGTWIIFRDDIKEHLLAHYNTLSGSVAQDEGTLAEAPDAEA